MIVDFEEFPLVPTATPTHKKHHPVPSPSHGPHYDFEVATETGHRTLWVVFVIMLVSTLAFTALAFRVPVQKRLFHVLTAFITLFATVSYFAMATGDGVSLHHAGVHHHAGWKGKFPHDVSVHREVYWARYVDWSVTTPLLLLDLSFLAGLNGASILIALVADVFMVLTGLFAAFGHGKGQIWGYYAMACIAYLVIVWQLVVNGRGAVKSKDAKTVKLFGSLAGFTFLLWTAYPIVWGVADGGRIASVNQEIIAYAVLDVLAKPIFGFWLLLAHDFTSATSISVGGFWAHGITGDGSIRVGADDDEGA